MTDDTGTKISRPLDEFFTPGAAARAGFIERRGGRAGEARITGLEYDSRRVGPGSLYFALRGIHADGHAFAGEAVKRGAAAVLHQDPLAAYDPGVVYLRVRDSRFAMSAVADAFYDHPSRRLGVVGVTGTEGKSPTVYLVYQLLRLLGKKAGFVSTVRYSHGAGETDNPEHQTTPEAPAVHRHLAAMLAEGAEYAVLEASSHGLSPRTNRLGDVLFDAGVMTNVTREHLEFHGTWEQYREDKSRLFRALDPFPDRPVKVLAAPSFGVVNADDPSAGFFAAATTRRVLDFSVRGGDAELSARSLESGGGGNVYEVRVRSAGETLRVRDALPGAFNAGNVLAALITVSELLGLPVREIAPLVSSLKPVRGRMTVVSRGQPFEVIVDYAHTPSSFAAIFPPLWDRIHARGGRIISVFGSGGERDRGKRPEQGRIASEYSALVVLTDEDPRGEGPMDILEEIARGCGEGTELLLIPDRPSAIREAFGRARPGDLVLLLGKGHENSIIYAGETRPYDEIAEAEAALAELGF
jgi:UDP-N-acetylmuramoyl-L-alanyl-D-glutamate--2,6-diaminopimelate ligase